MVGNKREVYLDYAATTPVDSAVVEAMLPIFSTDWGNASALYHKGRIANQRITEAREQIALVLGCTPNEIIFTSGGTESDNLALKGAAEYGLKKGLGNHLIVSAFEHHAVLHTAEYLKEKGFEITFLPVNQDGLVNPAEVERAIIPGKTRLLSVMYANNEIGTIQPIDEISRIARKYNVPFHTDAVQAAGQLPLKVRDLGVDMLSLSAHKFYGPKGVGLLYLRQGLQLEWQQLGGSQERKRRAGTENVPGIVGMAKALTLAEEKRPQENLRLAGLRDRLMQGIMSQIAGTAVNGTLDPTHRLANNLNVSFEGIDSEGLLQALDLQGIAASNGSACNVGSIEPSHVIRAISGAENSATGTVRLTLGKYSSNEDIEYVLEKLPLVVSRMRALKQSSFA
ncbi:cysteine desulfurase family protein [Candidatus Chlorohelix sp.]|uniref:cysteine desulfurase family protein n=1 Tax=Candidatus Chlorohelix sp. TaxID=3139201 RepID=UPI0030377B7B